MMLDLGWCDSLNGYIADMQLFFQEWCESYFQAMILDILHRVFSVLWRCLSSRSIKLKTRWWPWSRLLGPGSSCEESCKTIETIHGHVDIAPLVEAANQLRCWHRHCTIQIGQSFLHVLIWDLAAGRRWKRRRFWKTNFTILLYALFWILYCVPRTKNYRLVGQEHTALLRRLAEVQGGGLVRCIVILNSCFLQVLKASESTLRAKLVGQSNSVSRRLFHC